METFVFSEQGCWRRQARTPPSQGYVSSLRWQDKQAAPVSVALCEQCHGQIRLSNSFPGYSLLASSYLHTVRIFGAGLLEAPGTDTLRYI